MKTSVESFPHESTVLTVYVDAFPMPNPDNFTWFKCTETSCKELDREHSIIHTNGLKSSLVFEQLRKDDFGRYKVQVTNGVKGVLEQTYSISEKGDFL